MSRTLESDQAIYHHGSSSQLADLIGKVRYPFCSGLLFATFSVSLYCRIIIARFLIISRHVTFPVWYIYTFAICLLHLWLLLIITRERLTTKPSNAPLRALYDIYLYLPSGTICSPLILPSALCSQRGCLILVSLRLWILKKVCAVHYLHVTCKEMWARVAVSAFQVCVTEQSPEESLWDSTECGRGLQT